MRQTTYGEIPKINIFDASKVSNFLEEELETFDFYQNKRFCIYSDKKVIDNQAVNYLNNFNYPIDSPESQLKFILSKEFDNCEKVYPYLGEVFLNLFFNKKVDRFKKIHLFRKETCDSFFETAEDKNAVAIASWMVENSSPGRAIDIKTSPNKEVILEKKNNINFKIDYDVSFLGSNISIALKNYRFAIIDGYIESISEIHHMLHFAAKSKEPYVIFCIGMSEEVKNVIIQNNSRQITQIMPFSLTINENTANILNDIALLHNSDIITSLKGQTISQEMRKELKIGKHITFTREGFEINPVCSREDIESHISFLKNRIENSPPDADTSVIASRIKNLKNKILNIYVPEDLKKDIGFNRSLDYLLRMIEKSKYGYVCLEFDGRKKMFPKLAYDFVKKKVNMTKDIFYNIDKLLILEDKWQVKHE